MNILNIPLKVLLDKNFIKVIDGIAGAGKSSALHKILKDNKILYLRTTSTNKLKKDAMARYPECNCQTVAGGLFTTNLKDGGYYREYKDVEEDTIVIDEILQTNSKVFQYCIDNIGKKNIIITTDSHQMLAPGQGIFILEEFKKFCKREDVYYVELTNTLRARNPETKAIFEELYRSVDNE